MFALLVRSRKLCLGLFGLGLLHFSLIMLGLPSWKCPIRQGFNLPCPGCGLSRATIELLHGHIHPALEIHAFSPIVVLIVGLIGSAIVLPRSKRFRLANFLDRFDHQFTILLSISFLGYWLIRFCFFKDALYQFVM
jgi:Protein of unknown function (DUF2752)